MRELLQTGWPYLTAGLTFLLDLACSAHILIYKRDSRAATGWIGIVWLAPILGSILYILFGINRIRRKASNLRGVAFPHLLAEEEQVCSLDELVRALPPTHAHLAEIASLVERTSDMELLKGNRVTPLFNGDEAYPRMLEAIDRAVTSISLSTYIFGNDLAGRTFLDALQRAVERGVEVRVLIDSVGSKYSIPPIVYRLRSAGIRTAMFMPSVLPWWTPYYNLRNHRKILVIDGHIGFTGGMNIRENHLLHLAGRHATQDIHFEVTGPVVREFQSVFVDDWSFAAGEILRGDLWFPDLHETGTLIARAIADGPDQNHDKTRMAFYGALASARHSVRILTPYYLPNQALLAALSTASLRGVEVDIVLPAVNNLQMVQWASMAQMWQTLEWGCRVWLSPPPFDHSKLLIVDDAWTLIGSANWDPRSLRLNFEFSVECYDVELAKKLAPVFDQRKAASKPLTTEMVNARSLPAKVRDGVARLFSPYL